MLIDLMQLSVLLLALGMLYCLAIRLVRQAPARRRSLLTGTVFAVMTVLAMTDPIILLSGISLDARSIPAALAGLLGGPVPALITAAAALVVGALIDGSQVLPGIGITIISVLLGLLARCLSTRSPQVPRLLWLYLFGCLTHLALLLWLILLPQPPGPELSAAAALAVLLIFPPATALLGYLLDDSNQRLRWEKELLASEQKYRDITENALDGIMQATPEGRLVSINPAAAAIFGFDSRQHALGQLSDLPSQLYVNPQERLNLIALLRQHGKVSRFQAQMKTRDGRIIWSEINARAIYDDTGTFTLVESILRDITEQKNAQEDRLRLAEQLHQSQKIEALGELAGGIAHDFNNILGAIIGYSELAKENVPRDSDEEHYLSHVLQAALRARKLIKQILTFSRNVEVPRKQVEMHLVVDEALRLLRQTIPATIDIRKILAAEDTSILADPTQIHQIVMNLCTNSYHAMLEQGGTIEVSLTAVDVDRAGAAEIAGLSVGTYVRLSVCDNGEGIAPGVAAKIFEPFFSTKPDGRGTGMGLAVVHGIVTSHNGAINVESELGKGTRVEVYFPYYNPGTAVQERASQAPEVLPTGSEHILVVEDEVPLARLVQEMLQRQGYRVTQASSGIEALDLFRKDANRFDLVITDQAMPGMSGGKMAEQMLELRPELPIIICTGYSETINEQRARSIGVRALLFKPLKKENLLQIIRRELDCPRTTAVTNS